MIIEIKSSREDFKSDRKWPSYLEVCDRFFFATLKDVDETIFPIDQGLIIADQFGAEIIRDCDVKRTTSSIRKAITLSFAREAALRFLRVNDPGFNEKSVI